MGRVSVNLLSLKKEYDGFGVSELRRAKQLDNENRKLEQVFANTSLDIRISQDVP